MTEELEQRLRTLGHAVWTESFRLYPRDIERAMQRFRQFLRTSVGAVEGHMLVEMFSLAQWVNGACRTLVTTPTYWSAMACTTIHETASEDIQIPWPAFLVRHPRGSVVIDGKEYACTLVDTSYDIGDEDAPIGAFMRTFPVDYEEASGVTVLTHSAANATELLCSETKFSSAEDEAQSSVAVRAGNAIRRAVLGLLYTLQYTRNFIDRGARKSLNSDPRFGPPKHRVIEIGRPLQIDCRQAVADYIRDGGRGAPSAQSLVRGHYKRQVTGIGRAARKVIWVEPYWRGPEDAPILARPYKVGADSPKERDSG